MLGGTYPAQPAVDSVTCSYLRHLYVATATHTTDGWEPLNPLPAGLAVPTSRNATLPQQLHGWDTVVPQPRGMAAGSPEACQHINTLVCDAMDAPFSELPSGNNLKGILRGGC